MKKLIPLSLILASSSALAETPWKSDAELGVLITEGNTETQSINFKSQATYDQQKWRASAEVETIYKEENKVTSAERYLGKAKYDYKIITDLNYIFVTAQYENDKFSGYDYRVSEAAGYGHSLIKNPSLSLDAELGAGMRQGQVNTGDSESEAILRGSGLLQYKLSETAVLSEEGTVEGLLESTTAKSVTALKAKINSKLSMKVAYTVRFVDIVPAGVVSRDDRETSITLVYNL